MIEDRLSQIINPSPSDKAERLEKFIKENAPRASVLFPGDDDDSGRKAYQDFQLKLQKFCKRNTIPESIDSYKIF